MLLGLTCALAAAVENDLENWFGKLITFLYMSTIRSSDVAGTGLFCSLVIEIPFLLVAVSCRHKCNEPYRKEVAGCQCDSGCKERQDCCWDYEDACVEPSMVLSSPCSLFSILFCFIA